MAAASIPGRENNRRAAIIEGLRAGRSPTEIIQFFGYPRSTVYDLPRCGKNIVRIIKRKFQYVNKEESHSKERIARTHIVVERIQALISEDSEQSLRKLASIVGVSEPTMRRNAEKDLRYKSMATSHLVQNWLSDNIDMFWFKDF